MKKAFTLIEIVVVMGVVASLFVMIGLFSNQTRLKSLEFERARELIRGELLRARSDTVAGTFDLNWGVAFTTNSITRFAGSNYAGRNQIYDVMASFANFITISGDSEIVFNHPRGTPIATKTIIVTDGQNTATITVNALGVIYVQ